jgi:multidrug efflux pump subunit AcrA (membrane-fusion protein)
MSPVVGADASTVVTLYRPDMLQVRVDVRFEDIPKVSLGQAVTIANPALPKPISGKVLFISSKANIQKNTLEVKVALDEPVSVFKPEMLVNVTHLAPKAAEMVAESSAPMRLFVPQQLVLRDEAGPYVWVADQSAGVARKTAVTTGGTSTGGLVEISQGLSIGSRIISRGHDSLADGARIRIIEEETNLVATSSPAAGGPPAATERHALQRLPQGD